jgi:SAM-dependent methyltransferase
VTTADLSRATADYWSRHQVLDFDEPVTEAESFEMLHIRNGFYPGVLDLLPCDHPGETVLDFGCGPGHDTLLYLLNGARHVYAADVSWFGLSMLYDRLQAHGLLDRCTLMRVPENGDWQPPPVDHALAAGVLHHVSDPVACLRRIASGVEAGGTIDVMVYSSESWFFRSVAEGDPERFRQLADGGAPIAHAWTKDQVRDIAAEAGLACAYRGNYVGRAESEGPGLSSVYTLTRKSRARR